MIFILPSNRPSGRTAVIRLLFTLVTVLFLTSSLDFAAMIVPVVVCMLVVAHILPTPESPGIGENSIPPSRLRPLQRQYADVPIDTTPAEPAG